MGMIATATFVRAGAARRTVMTIFRRLCCFTTDHPGKSSVAAYSIGISRPTNIASVNGQISRSNGHAVRGKDRICGAAEIYILWGEGGGAPGYAI